MSSALSSPTRGSAESNITAILFWRDRFVEHFDAIGYFFKKYLQALTLLMGNKEDVVDLYRQGLELQQEWVNVGLAIKNGLPLPRGPEGLDELVSESDDFKRTVQEQFTQLDNLMVSAILRDGGDADAPRLVHCVANLLMHMREELEYFQDSILHHRWSYQREFEWWAEEHSENADFIHCFVLSLLNEYKGELSDDLEDEIDMLLEETKDLSTEFEQIQVDEEEEESRSGGSGASRVSGEAYQQMMTAKLKHVNLLDRWIDLFDNQLPDDFFASEEDRQTNVSFLEHELKEAYFAYTVLL